MNKRPLIGINSDYRAAQKGSPALNYVFSGYYESLLKAGALPIILPTIAESRDLGSVVDRLLDTLDGVVLTGGADLDPRRDGFMLHPTVRPMDERREIFDRFLMEKIAERRTPVFGIGTGMQLMNVALGGTLFLHIPEDMPKAMPHRDAMDPNHRHGLIVGKNSLLMRVYGENDVRVNSMHHMAVEDVARGFRATAHSPDGVIEAIESIHNEWFALGTQFHPEAHSATALDQGIFKEFILGVRERAGYPVEKSEMLDYFEVHSC